MFALLSAIKLLLEMKIEEFLCSFQIMVIGLWNFGNMQ